MPVTVDHERKAALLARLEMLRADGGLTAAHVRLAAEGHGVSERTIWRWLREPASNPRPSFALSEADREAFAFYGGNIAAVHRARTAALSGKGAAAGVPVPAFLLEGWAGAVQVAERTLYRAFEAQMSPAERAAWRTGEAGRRKATVYLRRPDAPRGRIWEMDHKQVPLVVLPPKGAAVRPWMTTVVDDGTRALLGWAVALYPNAGTVLSAMRMAMVHEAQHSDFGAVPERVRIDRGLEFAADAVTRVLAGLAVVVHRLPAYTPHRKGRVERLNLTLEQMLLSGLPGYTGGPRDAAGRLYGPVKDGARERAAAEVAGGPMRIERFVEHLAAWARWYNTEHVHRSLQGRTPAQAWAEDPAPLQRIAAEHLRHLLLADKERVIGKDGIRHNGLYYLAPELHGRGGQRVQIRYMPHDDRFVEVYRRGRHLCTAYPGDHLTPAQSEDYRAHARAEAKRLGAARRRAAARARRELAPMTARDPAPAESRLISPATGRAYTGRAADAELTARSRSSLLGLHPLTDHEEK